jgi:para-aminobenzoate synthetase/4-amino-4-deoxychorismate lyase
MASFDIREAPFVLLDDSRAPHRAGPSYLFHSPERIIVATSAEEIAPALTELDRALDEGFHLAGWIAYEVAGAFEPRLAHLLHHRSAEPFIWMMVTKNRETLSSEAVSNLLAASDQPASVTIEELGQSEETYAEALSKILSYIRAGDVYQINHTFPLALKVNGAPLNLYRQLRKTQPVPYGAYIETGEQSVLSLSPELFVSREGSTLTARPMKGTAPRGRTLEEDQQISEHLKADPKSRAENLMIVDLIRNDLSRCAEAGSVKVPALFETEQYPTLHQMTSTVTAKADESLTPSKLLAALFPCGSVTGAPKIRAMQIINELEDSPRGIYCGAIGHFSPSTHGQPAQWTLNVPIRTLRVSGDSARFHIGSGIVADSNIADEYKECVLKAAFLNRNARDFYLIETMRLERGNVLYLDRHLKRLLRSAAYYDIPVNNSELRGAVLAAAANSANEDILRMRLTLQQDGALAIDATALGQTEYLCPATIDPNAEYKPEGEVLLSSHTLNSRSAHLYHKSSNRDLYDQAFEQALEAGCLDYIFCNEQGHLTEGAISNIFLLLDGEFVTPPVTDGLLAGVLRDEILDSGLPVREASLTVQDLKHGQLFIGNALRGLRRVCLRR